jgi:hypothetical protein
MARVLVEVSLLLVGVATLATVVVGIPSGWM